MKNDNVKLKIIIAGLVLFFTFFGVASASTLYFLPQAQDVYFGDTFIIEARIDTENKEVNAIEGLILFPKDKMKVVDINKGGSIMSLWLKEPVYSNEKGEVDFSGGVPNGFIGQGTIFKITFAQIDSSLNNNDVKIYFRENSKILLNDGKGTIDDIRFLDGNYRIIGKEDGLPVISSSSWPDQEKWYRGNEVRLHWDLVKNAEYSYILTRDALAEPDSISDKPEGDMIWMGDMTLKGFTDDGIYYFNLKQKLPGKDWSGKISFKIMIDNVPPEEFVPRIAEIEGKKFLVFATKDATSGVGRLEVSEEKIRQINNLSLSDFIPMSKILDSKSWTIAQSPYLLQDQSLASIIKVKAIDKAGNERLAEIIPPVKGVTYQKVGLIASVLIIIILILAWIKYIKCNKKKNRV